MVWNLQEKEKIDFLYVHLQETYKTPSQLELGSPKSRDFGRQSKPRSSSTLTDGLSCRSHHATNPTRLSPPRPPGDSIEWRSVTDHTPVSHRTLPIPLCQLSTPLLVLLQKLIAASLLRATRMQAVIVIVQHSAVFAEEFLRHDIAANAIRLPSIVG